MIHTPTTASLGESWKSSTTGAVPSVRIRPLLLVADQLVCQPGKRHELGRCPLCNGCNVLESSA